jgi:hypothetical protein
MKIIHLYTGKDNKSYFEEIESSMPIKKELGAYSEPCKVKNMFFRQFEEGLEFDWHCAPQVQYIIYLEGQVEVEASGGEKRVFNPSDILYVTDISGKGHITRTLSKGKSIVVTED